MLSSRMAKAFHRLTVSLVAHLIGEKTESWDNGD